MPTLGCETHTVYLYARRGQHRITQVTGLLQVAWGRTLNEPSEATITVGIPSDPECCYWLGQVEPWAVEVVIYRGEKRVWEGPLVQVDHQRGQVVLYARDVFIWTSRRAHRGRVTAGPVNAMEEWELMFNEANSADQGVLEYFQQVGTSPNVVDRDISQWKMYYDEDLIALARNGFQFTTAGRRVIQFSDLIQLGQLPDLSTGDHILTDVKVTLRGRDLALKVFGINSAGQRVEIENMDGVAARVRYGAGHEYILDVDDDVSLQSLGWYANEAQFQRYPMPWSVSIPPGAQLSPDTPWDINQMIPGVHVNVKVQEKLCVEFHRPFMLSKVNVVEQAGEEKVSVDVDQLAPTYKPPEPAKPPRRQGPVGPKSFRDHQQHLNRKVKRLEGRVRP